ncbi:hypothetical protein EDB83DRAFT_2320266 [Lactarius deliciosus]|nr:hypothetical protein EDB83DRAFT_2320266 [Lactarius deliciosus]
MDGGIKFPRSTTNLDIMASQRLTIPNQNTRIPAKPLRQTTHGFLQNIWCELRLIVALSMRLPTRPVRDQIQSRRTDTPGGYNRHEAMIRQHGNNRRQDTTHTDNRDYQRSTSRSTTQSTNAGQNRYMALNPEATCDDILGLTTANDWTIVTHRRMQNAGSRRRGKEVATISLTTGPLATKQQTPPAKVEAHVGVPTCGDAQVEAHVDQSTRGDTHPSPIPSPNPGVTPLTKRLDAQSDVPGMLQLLRRIREVTLMTTETLQDEGGRPPTSTTTTTTTAAPTLIGLIRADHDIDHDSVENDQTAACKAARHAEGREHPQRMMDPAHRAEHYCQTLGPLTDEERHDIISRYLMEGRWVDNDREDVPGKPATNRMPTCPETSAGGCKLTAEGTPNLTTRHWHAEPSVGGTSSLPLEGRQRTTSLATRGNHPTAGEEDPIIAIDTLTDKRREKLREVLLESNVPLTKADLWEILMQIKSETLKEETHPAVVTTLVHSSKLIQLPSARTGKTLMPGNTLDEEELWDAFMRDDQEDMLSQLLGDDNANNNPPRGSDAWYRFVYEARELKDPDRISPRLNEFLDDEYDVLPLGEDDEASDFSEGEQDNTQPLRERDNYRVSLQHAYLGNPTVYPQHEDDKSFYDEEDEGKGGGHPLSDDEDPGDAGTDLSNPQRGLTNWTYKPEDLEELRATQVEAPAVVPAGGDTLPMPFPLPGHGPMPFIDRADSLSHKLGMPKADDDDDRFAPIPALSSVDDPQEDNFTVTAIWHTLMDGNREDCPTGVTQMPADRELIVEETCMVMWEIAVPPTLARRDAGPALPPPSLTHDIIKGRSPLDDPPPSLYPRWAFLVSLTLASRFSAWEIGCCERAIDYAIGWTLWVGQTSSRRSLPRLCDSHASAGAVSTVMEVVRRNHSLTRDALSLKTMISPPFSSTATAHTCMPTGKGDGTTTRDKTTHATTRLNRGTARAAHTFRDDSSGPAPLHKTVHEPNPGSDTLGSETASNDAVSPVDRPMGTGGTRAAETGRHATVNDQGGTGDRPTQHLDTDKRGKTMTSPGTKGRVVNEKCDVLGADCTEQVNPPTIYFTAYDRRAEDNNRHANAVQYTHDTRNQVALALGQRCARRPIGCGQDTTTWDSDVSQATSPRLTNSLPNILPHTRGSDYPGRPSGYRSPTCFKPPLTADPRHGLDPFVIMEADSLRRGVFSRFSTSPSVSPTLNDLANANTADSITMGGETMMLQSYRQVTQPMEYKVVYNWKDTQHLRNYMLRPGVNPAEHKISPREDDFQGTNTAI